MIQYSCLNVTQKQREIIKKKYLKHSQIFPSEDSMGCTPENMIDDIVKWPHFAFDQVITGFCHALTFDPDLIETTFTSYTDNTVTFTEWTDLIDQYLLVNYPQP